MHVCVLCHNRSYKHSARCTVFRFRRKVHAASCACAKMHVRAALGHVRLKPFKLQSGPLCASLTRPDIVCEQSVHRLSARDSTYHMFALTASTGAAGAHQKTSSSYHQPKAFPCSVIAGRAPKQATRPHSSHCASAVGTCSASAMYQYRGE